MDAWPGGNLVTALSAFLDVSSLNLAVPQGAAIFARAAIELPGLAEICSAPCPLPRSPRCLHRSLFGSIGPRGVAMVTAASASIFKLNSRVEW
jgi:hypothetical protein